MDLMPVSARVTIMTVSGWALKTVRRFFCGLPFQLAVPLAACQTRSDWATP